MYSYEANELRRAQQSFHQELLAVRSTSFFSEQDPEAKVIVLFQRVYRSRRSYERSTSSPYFLPTFLVNQQPMPETQSSAVHLPPELWFNILSSLDRKRDILALCLVSRATHLVAIETLYEDLSALGREPSRCQWLHRILTTPKLAYAVKKLKIDPSLSNWAENMGPLLRSVTNLREYVLLQRSPLENV